MYNCIDAFEDSLQSALGTLQYRNGSSPSGTPICRYSSDTVVLKKKKRGRAAAFSSSLEDEGQNQCEYLRNSNTHPAL